jgi:hypothetical protein
MALLAFVASTLLVVLRRKSQNIAAWEALLGSLFQGTISLRHSPTGCEFGHRWLSKAG